MKVTKKEQVRKYLETHKKGITQEIALEKFEVSKLSTIISNLQKDGLNIVCEEKKPRGKVPYKLYTLVNE